MYRRQRRGGHDDRESLGERERTVERLRGLWSFLRVNVGWPDGKHELSLVLGSLGGRTTSP